MRAVPATAVTSACPDRGPPNAEAPGGVAFAVVQHDVLEITIVRPEEHPVLRTLSRPLVAGVERYLPGAFVFAVALTVIVAALSLLFGDIGPVGLTRAWGDGLAGLLAFMTQVALVLLLGYTLATTRPVARALVRIASIPKTPKAAYAFVALVASIASLISFGLGLVVGGVIALEVGRAARLRGVRLHYPLLVASAYSGFAVWHMGYSATGPLAAATPGSFVEEAIGRTIPITDTVYSWWNLTATVVSVAAIVGSMVLLAPKGDDPVVELPEQMHEDDVVEPPEAPDDARRTARGGAGGDARAGAGAPALPGRLLRAGGLRPHARRRQLELPRRDPAARPQPAGAGRPHRRRRSARSARCCCSTRSTPGSSA